jgi:hypothetical protein
MRNEAVEWPPLPSRPTNSCKINAPRKPDRSSQKSRGLQSSQLEASNPNSKEFKQIDTKRSLETRGARLLVWYPVNQIPGGSQFLGEALNQSIR